MSAEFHYRVPWRAKGAHPGHHAGATTGDGFEFHGHAPLTARPDPRHLDVRATLSEPFGQLMVKSFRQSSAIPVYLLADLSASMNFAGTRRKIDLLAEFAAAIAFSAYRTGDPFGLFACDDRIRQELTIPLRWHKGLAAEMLARLAAFQPAGPNARGLLETVPELGRQKALVFVASDFHFPSVELESLLDALAHHDVVPVVLWDSAEYEKLPSWGWADLADAETGQTRRMFMRPSLRAAIGECYKRRREELRHLFVSRGREPFFLVDRFDPDTLTRYFYQA
ncbi:MAG: uncharacterized protein H6R26_1928 [Proteobacteria bacterium]|nr:uncharacterized protein [Pseudomonadota bacterium]